MSFFSNLTSSLTETVNAVTDKMDDVVKEAVRYGGGKVKGLIFDDLKKSPFEVREGCRITMFQDAHNGEDAPPKIITDSGEPGDYVPGNAYEEMYSAILNARRFVYITGWSVDTKISLLRHRDIFPTEGWPVPSGKMTVGELLKFKAAQGVKVMVHVWDEALSMSLGGMALSSGVMNTCDEETKAYFVGTGVEVQLSYRTGTTADNQVLWSHHQKTIIVDAPLEDVPISYEGTIEEGCEAKPAEAGTERGLGGEEDATTAPSSDEEFQWERRGRRFLKCAFMTCEHRYVKLWDDRKTGADPHMLAVFRPVAPDGYHILGDIAERSHSDYPSPTTKATPWAVLSMRQVVVVAEPRIEGYTGPPLLAEPEGYDLVWDGTGIGAWPKNLYIWKPLAPEGYHALGHVCSNNGEIPPTSLIRCVHESAVVPACGVKEMDGRAIWRDRKTGCKFGDVSIWGVKPLTEGLVTGTWIAIRGYERPTEKAYTLLPPPCGMRVADKDYDGVDESDPFVVSPNRCAIPTSVGPCGKRRIIAFVGGLDITGGRFDTPKHSLFRTLGTTHADDFYSSWGIVPQHGPRQPWHDIHAKVEGPIARDLLVNFEQRWRQQGATQLLQFGPELISQEAEEDLIKDKVPEEQVWEARLCRSIDPFSADCPELEQGIQYAYVQAVRSAQRFLYIENQYFLGSASHWLERSNVECMNLIPYEVAHRIHQAIKLDQMFTAYIVMPYFPEGWPEQAPLQEIMRWQFYTQQMMYAHIAEAIRESDNPDRHPTEFLNFFCLANRESEEGSTASGGEPTEPTLAREIKLYKSRRFQIYVHSKMMIADDNYIIWGSANINDRSMKGDRDTEVAVEAWQPHFKKEDQPRGAIHQFRMSLWAEHANASLPEFLNPDTPEAVAKMQEIGRRNLEIFAGEECVEMDSHLVSYPTVIEADGSIEAKPELVPDTAARVRGAPSTMLPDYLTT